MIRELHAELRKLVTVRSTFIAAGIALVFSGFIGLYAIGYRGGADFAATTMERSILDIVPITALFVGVMAILLIGHEYRYNTIYYTLTASNNRLKVLVAKLVTSGLLGIVFALVTIVWTLVMVSLGLKWGGHHIEPQQIDMMSVLWKSLAYMITTAWFGMLLGFISRNMTFALVVFFMLPMVEPLVIFLLKIKAQYLPSAAQGNILTTNNFDPNSFTPLASLGVFSIYLAVLALISAFLFVKRDAN